MENYSIHKMYLYRSNIRQGLKTFTKPLKVHLIILTPNMQIFTKKKNMGRYIILLDIIMLYCCIRTVVYWNPYNRIYYNFIMIVLILVFSQLCICIHTDYSILILVHFKHDYNTIFQYSYFSHSFNVIFIHYITFYIYYLLQYLQFGSSNICLILLFL